MLEEGAELPLMQTLSSVVGMDLVHFLPYAIYETAPKYSLFRCGSISSTAGLNLRPKCTVTISHCVPTSKTLRGMHNTSKLLACAQVCVHLSYYVNTTSMASKSCRSIFLFFSPTLVLFVQSRMSLPLFVFASNRCTRREEHQHVSTS